MKNIREIIIGVLLMWLVATFFLGKGVRAKLDQLDKEKAQLKQQLDSVTTLQRETAIHYMKAATELNTAKVRMSDQQKITETYRKKYESLKAVPRLTDAGIDSALSRLTENR